MDEFGKLIPIIIGLLYFLFGRGKGKEQRPNKRPVSQKKVPTTISTSIEDILRELSGESPKPKVEPSQPVKNKSAKRKKIEIEDHQYDTRHEYDHHASTGPDLEVIRKEIKTAQHIEDPAEIEFDLRQAIIYDAILNRPKI